MEWNQNKPRGFFLTLEVVYLTKTEATGEKALKKRKLMQQSKIAKKVN